MFSCYLPITLYCNFYVVLIDAVPSFLYTINLNPCYLLLSLKGVIDPISALGKIAVAHGIGLHVDCCLGGFILPFAKKLGYNIPGLILKKIYRFLGQSEED